MKPSWYVARLRAMSPAEVRDRAHHQLVKRRWRGRQVGVDAVDPLVVPSTVRPFAATLPADLADRVPSAAREALVEAADRVMDGHWEIFGLERNDYVEPDWFLDAASGVRAPQEVYAFAIPHRDQAVVGNIKNVWEPSRHHHLTVLAAAYWLTGDDRFAERCAAHLRSWWKANPFLSGVHWTSGIELGIRLVSWAWVRRLLDGWSGAPDLFERNVDALRQLHHHQEYLATLYSTGSSANNHVVAEAAGLLVAASAFPWFADSEAWRAQALDLLTAEVDRQTFESGVNRELASEYHGLTLELALVGVAELDRAGHAVPAELWDAIARMLDALAGLVDTRLHPARQGDGDDGLVLVIDDPAANRWASILTTGAEVLGAPAWWPALPDPDVRTIILSAVVRPRPAVSARPATRPDGFGDAGIVLMRTAPGQRPEVWVRGDDGPLGFLSIAAHGHADALALEVRHDGVDVIADPGTFCYHGDPEWRTWFRGTRGHATLELDGVDQAVSGGPFLWTRHGRATRLEHGRSGAVTVWSAEHDGYGRLDDPATHRRTVRLDADAGTLDVTDIVIAAEAHPCRLTWPLGPSVEVDLGGTDARLSWPGGSARFALDPTLTWSVARGMTDPVDGWYSPGFGRKVPASTLVGTGHAGGSRPLRCTLSFEV